MLSYWFLLTFPWYVTLPVIYGVTIAILWPIRAHFEGRAYNHSFASVVGCFGLTMAITIGGDVLKRIGHVDGFMGTPLFHLAIGIMAVAVGQMWQIKAPGPAGDSWHNEVSVPWLLYFLFTIIPTTLGSATQMERMGMITFLLVWPICLAIDIKTDRVHNAKYEVKHFH